jgi:hypothetical protein
VRPASRNTLAALILLALIMTTTATARNASLGPETMNRPVGMQVATHSPEPIPEPGSLARARAACPKTATRTCYLTALRHAYEAIDWQKHARANDARRNHGYGVQHALRLASAMFGVPLSQLENVGQCESHLEPTERNRTSTASGLFQFLDSTWTRAGLPGFSVYDPYANALAAARLVKADGGWREWSCGFAA